MIHRSAQIPDFCGTEAKLNFFLFLEKVTTIKFQPTNFLFVCFTKVSFKTLSSKNHDKKRMRHIASMNFGIMWEIRARILKVCKDQVKDIILHSIRNP